MACSNHVETMFGTEHDITTPKAKPNHYTCVSAYAFFKLGQETLAHAHSGQYPNFSFQFALGK